MKLTTEQLIAHLRVIADGIEEYDSLEGSFEYALIDHDTWEVAAAYRVNNLQGQGGMVLIQASPEHAEPR